MNPFTRYLGSAVFSMSAFGFQPADAQTISLIYGTYRVTQQNICTVAPYGSFSIVTSPSGYQQLRSTNPVSVLAVRVDYRTYRVNRVSRTITSNDGAVQVTYSDIQPTSAAPQWIQQKRPRTLSATFTVESPDTIVVNDATTTDTLPDGGSLILQLDSPSPFVAAYQTTDRGATFRGVIRRNDPPALWKITTPSGLNSMVCSTEVHGTRVSFLY